jgi:hypothetical protein
VLAIFSCRPERDSSARGEFAPDGESGRGKKFDKIVTNPVDPGFVELSEHPEGAQIQLEALAFNTELVRLVVYDDFCEIRLSGERA